MHIPNQRVQLLENWDIFKAKVQQFSIFAAVDKKRQRDYEILIAEEKLKRAQTKIQTLTPVQQAHYEAEMDRYRRCRFYLFWIWWDCNLFPVSLIPE